MGLNILSEVKKYESFLVKLPETALTTIDDKRYFFTEYKDLPWGHWEKYRDEFKLFHIF